MESDWQKAVVPTSQMGMCVLPAGSNSIATGDFDPLRMPLMASGWTEMFDIVLIDIGDAKAPFAQQLYKACDRSYMLIRLGRTSRDLADDMMDALLGDDVVLNGCIVTNMP